MANEVGVRAVKLSALNVVIVKPLIRLLDEPHDSVQEFVEVTLPTNPLLAGLKLKPLMKAPASSKNTDIWYGGVNNIKCF